MAAGGKRERGTCLLPANPSSLQILKKAGTARDSLRMRNSPHSQNRVDLFLEQVFDFTDKYIRSSIRKPRADGLTPARYPGKVL